MQPIITTLLDTDLYKFTMQQAILKNFPSAVVDMKFKCRSGEKLGHLYDDLMDQLDMLCKLRITDEEIEYLSGYDFFEEWYLEYLRAFQLNRDSIWVRRTEDDDLEITTHGVWALTTHFEIFVLAIVQELYSRKCGDKNWGESFNRVIDKANQAKAFANDLRFTITDFGTRRRYSKDWHNRVVGYLANNLPRDVFVGTSNVALAMEYGITASGTMAHEWLQLGQAVFPLEESQKGMLQTWCDTYRGKLGIALSDVVGFDAFLRDFDGYFARLYDGCRHDSGDPYVWTDKLIAHYEKLGIDPRTKKAIYSDGLDFIKAFQLASRYRGQIQTSFGIGTNLTNDIVDHKPLQIVMKMVKANGKPVAKISDSSGKGMCEDADYLAYLKKVFQIGE